MTADDLIREFGLEPLPWEGGYYRETWRSRRTVPIEALGNEYTGVRSTGTAIYYLLTSDTVSRMHRLPSDETFHFYLGDPVEMLLLHAGGGSDRIVFGQKIFDGQKLQFTVPGDTWMGARLIGDAIDGYALMGTTVTPGFDFDDLEMEGDHALADHYPDCAELIRKLS